MLRRREVAGWEGWEEWGREEGMGGSWGEREVRERRKGQYHKWIMGKRESKIIRI